MTFVENMNFNSPEYINMCLWGAWGRWIQDPLFCQSTFWTFRWSFLLLELAFLLELCRFCTHTVLSLATNISQKKYVPSQLLKVSWNISGVYFTIFLQFWPINPNLKHSLPKNWSKKPVALGTWKKTNYLINTVVIR